MYQIIETKYYQEDPEITTTTGILEGDGMDDGPLEFDTYEAAKNHTVELFANEYVLQPYEVKRPTYDIEEYHDGI